MKILREKIIVKESIGKILLESLIVSIIIVLIILGIVKLLKTETMINIMWQLVYNPECIILPLIPLVFSLITFTRFVVTSIKEEKE